MPTSKQRLVNIIAVTLIFAAAGLLAGYFFAWKLTEYITRGHLTQYATQIMTEGEASAGELRTALTALDASQLPACSSSEVAYFRALIFESDFLKDAGRMKDDRIQCSAATGKPSPLNAASRPNFTQQDGTVIYMNPAPYQNTGVATMALGRGDFFVVYTPLTQMYMQPAPMHLTITDTDAPTQTRGRLLGEDFQAPPEILATEGEGRLGSSLYATRCSIRYFQCATSWGSLPEVVTANRTRFNSCIALTGIAGGLLGLIFSLLYRRNKSMEQQLRRAIRREELRVVYQPIVDMEDGRIIGAEALARWTDEDGTSVGPDVFVRTAEKNGFVGELTRLVLRHILDDFGNMLRTQPDFRVSLNVSAADLADPEFPDMLERTLARAEIDPACLTIELTESSTMNRGAAIETIHLLRWRGHHIHIDDFGTGYSSLAYLKDLSVDAIKIDKSFTQAIGTESVTVSILPQILSMAETLDLGVIVEGVETTEQASYFATSSRPISAQGWLYGRPLALAEFQRTLHENRARVAEPAACAALV